MTESDFHDMNDIRRSVQDAKYWESKLLDNLQLNNPNVWTIDNATIETIKIRQNYAKLDWVWSIVRFLEYVNKKV